MVQTQTLDLLQTRRQAGHGRLARCLAFAIWGRLLGWQRRLGLRLEERPRAALRIDIVAKEPHRKLVVVGQVVDLAPLAAVTNDQVVCGRKASLTRLQPRRSSDSMLAYSRKRLT